MRICRKNQFSPGASLKSRGQFLESPNNKRAVSRLSLLPVPSRSVGTGRREPWERGWLIKLLLFTFKIDNNIIKLSINRTKWTGLLTS